MRIKGEMYRNEHDETFSVIAVLYIVREVNKANANPDFGENIYPVNYKRQTLLRLPCTFVLWVFIFLL